MHIIGPANLLIQPRNDKYSRCLQILYSCHSYLSVHKYSMSCQRYNSGLHKNSLFPSEKVMVK